MVLAQLFMSCGARTGLLWGDPDGAAGLGGNGSGGAGPSDSSEDAIGLDGGALVDSSEDASTPDAYPVHDAGGELVPCPVSEGLQSDAPWPMFRRCPDGRSRTSVVGAQSAHVRWTLTLTRLSGQPVIAADGTLYISSTDHGLYAVSSNGTLKWDYDTHSHVLGPPAIGADGTVYFGADDEYAYAVRSDGTLKWKFQAPDAVNSPAAIGSNGTVYLAAYGLLFAFEETGQLKWSQQFWGFGQGVVFTNSGDLIVTDSALHRLDPSGTESWHFEDEGPGDMIMPAVGVDDTLYSANLWHTFAVHPNKGVVFNIDHDPWAKRPPALGEDGTVYIQSRDDGLQAFSPAGQPLWTWDTGGTAYATSVPAVGGDGTIYTAVGFNTFGAIRPDGSLFWKLPVGDLSLTYGAAIGADGTVYFIADDTLYAAGP